MLEKGDKVIGLDDAMIASTGSRLHLINDDYNGAELQATAAPPLASYPNQLAIKTSQKKPQKHADKQVFGSNENPDLHSSQMIDPIAAEANHFDLSAINTKLVRSKQVELNLSKLSKPSSKSVASFNSTSTTGELRIVSVDSQGQISEGQPSLSTNDATLQLQGENYNAKAPLNVHNLKDNKLTAQSLQGPPSWLSGQHQKLRRHVVEVNKQKRYRKSTTFNNNNEPEDDNDEDLQSSRNNKIEILQDQAKPVKLAEAQVYGIDSSGCPIRSSPAMQAVDTLQLRGQNSAGFSDSTTTTTTTTTVKFNSDSNSEEPETSSKIELPQKQQQHDSEETTTSSTINPLSLSEHRKIRVQRVKLANGSFIPLTDIKCRSERDKYHYYEEFKHLSCARCYG